MLDAAPVTTTNAAYGFRWTGLSHHALTVRASGDWPAVAVQPVLTDGSASAEVERVGQSAASIKTPAARLRLDRWSSRLEIHSPGRLPVADVIHPALWPAAAVFARWHDRETFHAGAVSFDGDGAWAILGERGAGKSSLLTALALEGEQVLADDLLVAAGQRCFAGPRCVDLRPEAAAALSIEPDTAVVRSTQRRRLMLPPCAGEYALRGFVHLRWGAEIRLERLLPVERLPLLLDHRRVTGLGADFEHVLDLVALPAIRLTRPPGWRATRRLAGELGDRLSELAAPPARPAGARPPATTAPV